MNVKRRLTVRRLRQFLERTVPRDLAQRSSQNPVRFLKHFPGRGMMGGQLPSHPNTLCSLARKQQRDLFCHVGFSFAASRAMTTAYRRGAFARAPRAHLASVTPRLAMAFVTREMKSPAPVTGVAAADARMRENLG